MDEEKTKKRIAFIGDYLPRKCGIATFTHDLRTAVAAAYPEAECFVISVNDQEEGYDYPPAVRFEFAEQDTFTYQKAADFLNFSNVDIVCLQHEFGIYGGRAGSHILALLRDLRMPIVTTMHTILPEPDPTRRRVTEELTRISARLVVMSERGRQFLQDVYQVPPEKIDLIAHGIPDMPFVDPNFYKDKFGVEGKYVVLTFGLLTPTKGIENVLQALPRVVEKFPNLVYIVLGATHPAYLRENGEAYRLQLERLTDDLGLENHVSFYNRFVALEELKEFIGAADIYITPYLLREQITSGTLAYSFGCGKAVISTPYWHAEELLAENRGALVPFKDPDAIANEMLRLLEHETERHAMRKNAYMLGREMIWSEVARRYIESFQRAREQTSLRAKGTALLKSVEQRRELPLIRLDQLRLLTDGVGIFEHSHFHLPDFRAGYCTDNNARALVLTVMLHELGQDMHGIQALSNNYAAFLNYAFDLETNSFRKGMSFTREWSEEEKPADDVQGRVIWALGTCVGRPVHRSLQGWAAQLFTRLIPITEKLESPRSWAFALLGIQEYFRQLSGDRPVDQARQMLMERLVDCFESHAAEDWLWFEDKLTFENAKLPQALLQCGRWTSHGRAFEIGLESLTWLMEIQTTEAGYFRPIGTEGFYERGQEPAQFDQQPIEACATISACLEAYRATNEGHWFRRARQAFDWFLGRNDLGLALYDSYTGGCADALQVDRLNQNQGAEATLSFLLALAEMRSMANMLSIFNQPLEIEPLMEQT